MPAKTNAANPAEESMTVAVERKDESYKGPTVRVFLPELESGGNGITADQYEHVTIANEKKEDTYYIHRGESVEVPVPVFMVLKQRYPKL